MASSEYLKIKGVEKLHILYYILIESNFIDVRLAGQIHVDMNRLV